MDDLATKNEKAQGVNVTGYSIHDPWCSLIDRLDTGRVLPRPGPSFLCAPTHHPPLQITSPSGRSNEILKKTCGSIGGGGRAMMVRGIA